MTTTPTVAEQLERLAKDAAKTADDIAYYSGGSKHNQAAEDLTRLVMNNLPAILTALRTPTDHGTPSARIMEDKDRENSVEGLHPNHGELVERLLQLAGNTGKMTWVGDWAKPASDVLREAATALSARPDAWREGEETFATINQWCDDTFGLATVQQIIARAKEEFEELEAPDADHAIEAADVVICLCRVPGFAEALQRKMAINRARKWRLVGNGTGYHIPDNLTEGA